MTNRLCDLDIWQQKYVFLNKLVHGITLFYLFLVILRPIFMIT